MAEVRYVNLTRFAASQPMLDAGVVDLCSEARVKLKGLLDFSSLGGAALSSEEMERRAAAISELFLKKANSIWSKVDSEIVVKAMIGGIGTEHCFIPFLERELIEVAYVVYMTKAHPVSFYEVDCTPYL